MNLPVCELCVNDCIYSPSFAQHQVFEIRPFVTYRFLSIFIAAQCSSISLELSIDYLFLELFIYSIANEHLNFPNIFSIATMLPLTFLVHRFKCLPKI